jgi:hypothetical protein
VSKGPFTTPYCKKQPAGLPACATNGTEVTCSTATGALISSGGGFSNVAAQPAWQADAVKAYLASGAKLPPKADFNATGRGYPDVSALGHNVIIWLSGQPLPVDGTSCSTPIWGGVMGMVNAARIAAGKAVVGFANPALYQLAAASPAAFHDITKGDNSCTEGGCNGGKCTGFVCTHKFLTPPHCNPSSLTLTYFLRHQTHTAGRCEGMGCRHWLRYRRCHQPRRRVGGAVNGTRPLSQTSLTHPHRTKRKTM